MLLPASRTFALCGLLVLGASCGDNASGRALSSLTFGSNGENGNACVVAGNGDVYCWSATGNRGAVGRDGTGQVEPGRAYRVDGVPPAAVVRSGLDVVWASTGDAGVYWWGTPTRGPLRGGCVSCAPRQLPEVPSVSKLATDGYSACGLVGDEVWCWGRNEYGELGIPPDGGLDWLPARRVLGGAVDVSMAYGTVCATLREAVLACWGAGMPSTQFTDIAYYSNGCALTRHGTLQCANADPPVDGVRLLGRRDGAYNLGNCLVAGNGEVSCWDFDDGLAARKTIAGVTNPLELAVTSWPRRSRPADEDHACALLTDGGAVCFSLDVPVPVVRTVPGLP